MGSGLGKVVADVGTRSRQGGEIVDTVIASRDIGRMDRMFADAQKYRDNILSNFQFSEDGWDGQSYAVVYPTKFCPVGCTHCYFASPKPSRKITGYRISSEDTRLLMSFLNQANVGILQITGGGEPLLELDTVVSLINGSHAKRIDIHTSAVTLSSIAKASDVIEKLFVAFDSSASNGRLNFRVSIDEFHLEKMKPKAINNVVSIFRRNYSRYAGGNFFLKLHSLIGDNSIPDLLSGMSNEIRELKYAEENEYKKSYGKPMPVKAYFKDGFEIDMDYSLRMLANASPDMDDVEQISKAIAAYDGLRLPTPGRYLDPDGRKGLCFIVHEDGNIELWNTGLRDNIVKIRTGKFSDFKSSIFSDVIQVAALEKTALYVESLLAEVNSFAIRRAKAIGSATHFYWNAFVEPRDRLYVSIRVIQDYLSEGRIRMDEVDRLDPVVQAAVFLSRQELRDLYLESSLSQVVSQSDS